jgi:hypothetical protein
MLLRTLVEMLTPRRVAYIQIHRDKITVRDAISGRMASGVPASPFSTRRLLVGDFLAAESCLSDLIRQLYGAWPRFARPTAVIHPVDMVEDGLAPVEHRIFYELAEGAGCRNVTIYEGPSLSDEAVVQVARSEFIARSA